MENTASPVKYSPCLNRNESYRPERKEEKPSRSQKGGRDGDGPRGSVGGSIWKGHRILHTKREEINWKADSFVRHLATHTHGINISQKCQFVWQHRSNEFLKWRVALRKRRLAMALESQILTWFVDKTFMKVINHSLEIFCRNF